jgi:trehalose synthase
VNSYGPVLGAERVERVRAAVADLADRLGPATVWAVNSTRSGGGVAEMLARLVPLARALGVRVGWHVIGGDPDFFAVTKRLCERLYGSPGDGGPLGPAERACYERTLRQPIPAAPGDVVVLHDPQTAGLIPMLVERGCTVIWRCHVGVDAPDEHSTPAWEFLRPYLSRADATVFTLREHAPPWLERVRPIAPALDPLAPKNRDLPDPRRLLADAGLFAAGGPLLALEQDRPIDPDRPLVVQVSRWDRLKDMPGVATGFAAGPGEADLLLAGPATDEVADDPGAAAALTDCRRVVRDLPGRERIHLATLSTADADRNALLVNALQRHAAVVTQKSLAEGFGLTVTEAMWKAAPVVASAVGGIRAQLRDGVEGRLVHPADLDGFGRAVASLVADRGTAARLGAAARERVRRDFLLDRQLLDWAALLGTVR